MTTKTDLLSIPYVGKNTKEDLLNIGITCVEELKGRDPEDLYLKVCSIKKYQEDNRKAGRSICRKRRMAGCSWRSDLSV